MPEEQDAPARPLLVPPTRAPPAKLSFSQEANSKPHISKDATEKTMAWTTAGSRSGMGGYELHDQLSEQFFRPAGGYFANFSSSVAGSVRKSTLDRPLYSSGTLIAGKQVAWNAFFLNKIDDTGIWNRALNAAEVAGFYCTGTATYSTDTISSSGPYTWADRITYQR